MARGRFPPGGRRGGGDTIPLGPPSPTRRGKELLRSTKPTPDSHILPTTVQKTLTLVAPRLENEGEDQLKSRHVHQATRSRRSFADSSRLPHGGSLGGFATSRPQQLAGGAEGRPCGSAFPICTFRHLTTASKGWATLACEPSVATPDSDFSQRQGSYLVGGTGIEPVTSAVWRQFRTVS